MHYAVVMISWDYQTTIAANRTLLETIYRVFPRFTSCSLDRSCVTPTLLLQNIATTKSVTRDYRYQSCVVMGSYIIVWLLMYVCFVLYVCVCVLKHDLWTFVLVSQIRCYGFYILLLLFCIFLGFFFCYLFSF